MHGNHRAVNSVSSLVEFAAKYLNGNNLNRNYTMTAMFILLWFLITANMRKYTAWPNHSYNINLHIHTYFAAGIAQSM
jgi:hypothetical protein